MTTVRVALPPMADLTLESPLAVAWLDPQGRVLREAQSTLLQLGGGGGKTAIDCFLHPCDSHLTPLELPALPAGKITAAVQCAAQALILGDVHQMHVAHSPRDASGCVHIAWLPRLWLQQFRQLLNLAGLKLRGLFPAPYALASGGVAVACIQDEYVVVRLSLEHGEVQPLMDDSVSNLLLRTGGAVQWIGADATQAIECVPATQRWTGTTPGWGLHAGWQPPRGAAKGWGRALACMAAALAVWTLGLNLYAAREAAEGQRLKTQMSQRMKQAFPELPVILNPLQQARQQLAARQNVATGGFVALVTHAGNGMPFMVGSVQRLVFEDGVLQLGMLDEGRIGKPDPVWQTALTQAGIDAEHIADGWALRQAVEVPAADAEGNRGTDDE